MRSRLFCALVLLTACSGDAGFQNTALEDGSTDAHVARDGATNSDANRQEPPCGTFAAGTELAHGEHIASCDGRIRLNHRANGNVTLNFTPNGYKMWSTDTLDASSSTLTFSSDGALVLRDASQAVLWSNEVSSATDAWLSLSDQGVLSVWEGPPPSQTQKQSARKPIWATDTAFCDRPKERFGPQSLRGKTINYYTHDLMTCAEAELGFELLLTQGSFNNSVSASAGTHDKGGVIDIRLKDCDSCSFYSAAKTDKVVRALRRAGFAAWRRGTWDAFSPHIHAVAVGDSSVASVAASQVVQYFNGTDGLAQRAYDRELDRVGRPIPPWAADYQP